MPLAESGFIKGALHERAERLLDDAHGADGVLAALREQGALDEESLLRLWQIRWFLPNWGKGLWGNMASLPDTTWIDEALSDPWVSPEERVALA